MKRKTRLLIYGAGGHGSVVLDAALRSTDFDVIGLIDDDPALLGKEILGVEVLGGIEILKKDGPLSDAAVVVAIGDAKRRKEVVGRVERLGLGFVAVIHPSAVIGGDARSARDRFSSRSPSFTPERKSAGMRSSTQERSWSTTA